MKDCKDCEYFCHYDSDGCPICDYKGGFENCPFNDYAPAKEEKVEDRTQIVIDVDYMTQYIRETMKNTFKNEAHDIAVKEIEKIVKAKYESIVQTLTEQAVSDCVQRQVEEFMAGKIEVGGWREPVRTLTRNEYMAELVEKALNEKADNDHLVMSAKSAAKETIEKFAYQMKKDINKGIQDNFNEVTRKTLTDSVVAMLMSSETYQGLAAAAQKMLT